MMGVINQAETMATFDEDWAKLKATTGKDRVIPLLNHDPGAAIPDEKWLGLEVVSQQKGKSWIPDPEVAPTLAQINEAIKHVNSNQVSDGYHTFGELYDHRIELWISLCYAIANRTPHYAKLLDVWRSEYHSDGEKAFGGGWFVLGVGQDKGQQITYHLPMSYWDQCSFAETLNKAPEWDGYSASDVLERLKTL